MTSQWFYGRGTDITGPVTDRQLFDLAARGAVLRTDIVWREGVEMGVPAGNVKNLFAITIPPTELPAPYLGANGPLPANESPMGGPNEVIAPAPAVGRPNWHRPRQSPTSPRPNWTGVGGQGGGHHEPGRNLAKIPRQVHDLRPRRFELEVDSHSARNRRAGFFCTKCRKRREVEIHGIH